MQQMIGMHYTTNTLQEKSILEVKCKKDGSFAGNEPVSVLDTRSPSPSTSTSTLSSSFGGENGENKTNLVVGSEKTTPKLPLLVNGLTTGGGAGGVAKEEWVAEMQGLELSQVGTEKFNLGLEDWESLLSESAGPEQSLLKWISGDAAAEDSSFNIKPLLTEGNSIGNVVYVDFDQNSGFETLPSSNSSALAVSGYGNLQNQNLSSIPSNSVGVLHQEPFQCLKTQSLKYQFQNFPNLQLLNSMFLGGIHEEQQPQPKRHNTGIMKPPKAPFLDPGNELLLRKPHFPRMQLGGCGQQQLNMLHSLNPQEKTLVVPKPERVEGHGNGNPMLPLLHNQQQQQQVVYDQLYKATELILAGNFSHAQGILARLNHLLSPVVKPHQRAAFYFKEALQLSISPGTGLRIPNLIDGMFKMGAYKTLSEVSPLVQFMNFTSNQAILEALDNSNAEKIHIVDFDIGIGAQWSSFMQELPRRNKGAISLKITAFASPSTHHSFDISLMHETLSQFANDVDISFELEVVNFDSFDPSAYQVSSFRSSDNEVIVVNFPIWSIASRPSMLSSVLCLIKQLSPKVVVLLDCGCERFDLPPTHHLLHALQYYEALLGSIDAANMSADAVNKIGQFLLLPRIESIVSGRLHSPNQMPTWGNLFASAGFSPVPLSSLSEAQAECVVHRTQVRGFHVEKRQASLVLCWQRRELLSASVWRF